MADDRSLFERRQAQEARARLLSDPDAAAEAEAKAQEHADQQTSAEGAFDPGYDEADVRRALAEVEQEATQSVVAAQVTEHGILVSLLVPWGAVAFAQERDAPEA